MPKSVTYRACAKINLLLDVTGKLPNGYHSVAMVNHSIDLYDTVSVETTGRPGIEINCSLHGVPLDKRNVAHKACKAFGVDSGLRVTIEKRIPAQAGLAGGSANAAAVFAALRDIYAPAMTDEALREIAITVGADVPFCLTGGCCLAEGVGERLSSLPCLPGDYALALVKPAFSVSTTQAYAKLDQINFTRPQTARAVSHAKQGDWEAFFPLCANVFEQALDFAALHRAKQDALRAGALLAQLTGSGSAVFAVYRKDEPHDEILRALAQLGEPVSTHRFVPCGVQRAGVDKLR